MKRAMLGVCAGAAALGLCVGALAETDDARAVRYRLTRAATLDRGCYDPCDCLLERASDFRGAFTLRLVERGPVFDRYEVSDVRLRARLTDGPIGLAGRGTLRISGADARVQQMTLSPSENGGLAERYASAEGSTPAPLPVVDVEVSMNGMVCFDTVMRLHAAPWRRPGDTSGDDRVDSDDLAALLAVWGTDDFECDVNLDGLIDSVDLALTLGNWGAE